ncbi:hypothetical protein CFP56_042285 [Quercus suber]|uniref:Uncharacterized protein n=1 Tax=Quercus suber TaxID=58331 RepID=A0AAW0LIC5_QUESU
MMKVEALVDVRVVGGCYSLVFLSSRKEFLSQELSSGAKGNAIRELNRCLEPPLVIMTELPPIGFGTSRSKVRGPSYLGTQQGLGLIGQGPIFIKSIHRLGSSHQFGDNGLISNLIGFQN